MQDGGLAPSFSSVKKSPRPAQQSSELSGFRNYPPSPPGSRSPEAAALQLRGGGGNGSTWQQAKHPHRLADQVIKMSGTIKITLLALEKQRHTSLRKLFLKGGPSLLLLPSLIIFNDFMEVELHFNLILPSTALP